MALVATVGGPTSDSYVTLQEADRFFQNHYSLTKKATWAALTQVQKESALKRACQQLETLKMLDDEFAAGRLPVALTIDFGYDLTIHRAEINQRLQLPRNIDLDADGEPFMAQEAKDSQCEQAIHLIVFDDSALVTLQQGIEEEAVTAGPVKTYTKYTAGFVPTYLSPMAVELMRSFLRPSSRMRRA